MAWKQRLYAFLLRRFLGPLLTKESNDELSNCIELSFQEGHFLLKNTSLDPGYLTNLLQRNQNDTIVGGVQVDKVFLKKVSIQLSIRSTSISTLSDEKDVPSEKSSVGSLSIMKKLVQLGYKKGSMALYAFIEIDGFEIHISPMKMDEDKTVNIRDITNKIDLENETNQEQHENEKGYFASIVDSAIKSLRLNIEINNFHIRFVEASTYSDPMKKSWLGISINSISYRDQNPDLNQSSIPTIFHDKTILQNTQIEQSKYNWKEVLGKLVEISGFSLQISSSDLIPTDVSTIIGTNGFTTIHLKAFTANQEDPGTTIHNEIMISMNEHISIHLDPNKLQILHVLSNTLTECLSHSLHTHPSTEDLSVESNPISTDPFIYSSPIDANKLYNNQGIMQRYEEAHHFALTRELRGGMILPASFGEKDGATNSMEDYYDETEFDTFFDCNETSFSQFLSNFNPDSATDSLSCENKDFFHTYVHFYLHEGSLKTSFTAPHDRLSTHYEEYVSISFQQLEASASLSETNSMISTRLSYFEIGDAMLTSFPNSTRDSEYVDVGHILRFSQDDNSNMNFMDAPSCISISVVASSRIDETLERPETSKNINIDVSCQPIEITYRPKTFKNIANIASCIDKDNTNGEMASNTHKTCQKSNSFILNIRYPEIVFFIPLDERKTKSQEMNNLFSRAGHYVDKVAHQPTLCIAFMNSSLDHGSVNGSTFMSETCTVYISSPSSVLDNQYSTVLEILSLSSDPTISKESVLKLHFHENTTIGSGDDIKSSFPIVPLLSSVKARQEENNDDHAIRGNNPQMSMMNDAERCQFYFNIQVPFLVMDIHSMERKFLSNIISSIEPIHFDNDKKDSHSSSKDSNKRNLMSIGLYCEQLSISYHHKDINNNIDNEEFTIFTVIDHLKCHAVTGESGLQNLRCLSQNVTVYEATRIRQTEVERENYSMQNQNIKHGKKLRARGLIGLEDVTPIFHRSNLAYPLSPETPLFLLDVIMNVDCDYSNDIQVHFSVYDLTYRYALDSVWFQRILSIIKDCNDTDLHKDNKKSLMSEKEESSPVIKLFVTLSDNVIDYTPPIKNFQPSRTLIRFGEIRLSCNLIVNASIQAYKASVADVAVYICNWRFPYHTENLRLSCSRQIMKTDDLHTYTNISRLRYASVEEVLQEMNFISIANLDSLDANVRIQTNDYGHEKSNCKNDQADTMIILTMGQLSLYSCKDSFTCMTTAIDEWVLQVTALSDDEIESLKKSTIPTNQIKKDTKKSKTQIVNLNVESNVTEPASKWNLLDAIDDDIFMEKRKSSETYVTEGSHILQPKNILPFANVPDSELSATELRTKHGLIELDKDISDMTEPLLIKNFYIIKPNGLNEETFKNQNDEASFIEYDENDTFESDEDEWTTIDRTWSRNSKSDDNSESSEQKARWFTDVDTNQSVNESIPEIKIYPHHVPITKLKEDPVLEESMDAAQYAGTVVNPNVKLRLFVKNLNINCRFFDGYDWNNSTDILAGTHRSSDHSIWNKQDGNHRKDELMNELLFDDFLEVGDKHFDEIPLSSTPQKCRQTNCFFQFLFEGIIARMDSYTETKEHRLASCLRLKVNDFSLIEAISDTRPKKMLGEWVNEVDHPRDSDDGVIMLKTISMKPICRFSADGKILSDESVAKLDLLPLRCYIDQKALRFIKAFFTSNEDNQSLESDMNDESNFESLVMGTFFKSFDVTSTKLKVNYNPIGVDMVALKDGCYGELLNLFPLEGMELYLQPVRIQNLIGWGACLGETSSRWIEDIASSQIHKFIAGASPFHTISNVSEGMADLVLIPIHHYKYRGGKHMGRAVRKGTSKFASTVAAEALDNTSKLTKHLAVGLTELSPLKNGSDMVTVLPSRPERAPHSIGDTVEHAYESVSKGLRTANYTIIVVPRKEYQKNGTTGAVKSVIRALPIAVLAPLSGASEALSYSLLGMRNQLRPEILKEEEASRRGI